MKITHINKKYKETETDWLQNDEKGENVLTKNTIYYTIISVLAGERVSELN